MATAIPFHGAELDRAIQPLIRTDVGSILRAFDEAPPGEPLSPEEEAECAERDEDLRSGRVEGVRHDEVRRHVDEMREPPGT